MEIGSVIDYLGAYETVGRPQYERLLAKACAEAGQAPPLGHRDVVLSDHTTAITDEGEGEPPIVLLHSLGLDRRMANGIIQPLTSRGRVIAYDLRLHGRATAASTRSFTLSRCAEDLRDLLDSLNIRQAHVAGFSLGGAVAQLFALANGSRLASLALICTMAKAPRSVYLERAESAQRGGMESQVSSTLSRWFNIGELAKNTAGVRYARMKVLTTTVEQWARYWHSLAEIDTIERLIELRVPTSVISAEYDKSTPPTEMRQLAERIPGAHFEMIPTAPHLTSLECPDETARALVGHLNRVERP